ncbi:MAG TPA: hypothetical protein VGM06_02670 [Polyangiaceae bacterium]
MNLRVGALASTTTENFWDARASAREMDYRDPNESLRIRRESIARDLTEAREAAERALELAQRVTQLEKDLSETNQLLEVGVRRRLSILDQVKIASPCTAKWEDMVGDDRIRFCAHCRKDVYDLSAMQRDEAEALLHEKSGGMCARLYRRVDGTVMTADCPTGLRRKRRRRAVAATVGGGVLAVAALGSSVVDRSVATSTRTMGAVAIPIRQLPVPNEPQDIEPPTMGFMRMGKVAVPRAKPVPTPVRQAITR